MGAQFYDPPPPLDPRLRTLNGLSDDDCACSVVECVVQEGSICRPVRSVFGTSAWCLPDVFANYHDFGVGYHCMVEESS